VPPVQNEHTTAVEIPKAEPGKDIFADHPHLDIKSEGRPAPPAAPKDGAPQGVKVNEHAPPVGEPKTEAKKAPEVISTAGQPGDNHDQESTVASKPDLEEKVMEVKKEEVKKEDVKTTEGAKVEAGPLLEEDIEADRVAKDLYENGK
jgi:hypothetical protein